ncbi:MAG TPA: chorismate mutase [Terriglobales bacterium]|jgi:chorismate mutase
MRQELTDWRAAIDVNDRQLVQLINIRARLACELAKVKRELGVAMVDPTREQEVVSLALQSNAGPLDDVAITRIFESIIEETRRVQTVHESA